MDKNEEQVNIKDALLLTHNNKSYTLNELQQEIEQLQDKLFFTQEELKDYKAHFNRVSLELKTKEQQYKDIINKICDLCGNSNDTVYSLAIDILDLVDKEINRSSKNY